MGDKKIITYDGLGRQSSRTTPDAGLVKYKYDKNDNLRFSQDNNQANKPTERPPARYITYRGYDGLNRLLYIGDSYNESYLPVWSNLNPDITYDFENYNLAQNNFLVINVYDTLTNYPANANVFSERLPADYYTSAPRNTNNTKGSLCATAYRTLGTDEWSFKYYRYDARGRVIKMWNYIAGLGEKSTEYSYNSQNQITDMKYENEDVEGKEFKYDYDYAGRLQSTSIDYIPSNSPENYLSFNSYSYNQNSQINTFSFDPISLSYTSEYDTRNKITMFSNDEENPFSYSLEYFANSNIQSQTFSGYYKDNYSNQYDLSFNYTYDESNRLLEANCTSTEDNTFDLINSYDPDGNILSLQRYGSNNNLFDNYNYAYYAGTNRLRIVSGTTNQFTYDYNGNMTNDYMNNNTGIKYDHRNLITEITNQNFMVDPPRTYITRYRYDEAGNRTRKTVFLSEEYDPPPLPEEVADLPPGWTIIVDDYYSRDISGKEIGVYSSYTLQYWNVWSGNEITGRINYAGNSKYYYLKDHLGSVRAVLDEGKTVISANDYDMWGYYLENRTYEPYTTKNKFTGKERDNESTYDYFGARYYDSRVGRWGATDPLFEKHIQFTPYNYVLGNTLRLIDPDGFIPRVTLNGNNINFEFSFYYTKYESDQIKGLTKDQITAAEIIISNMEKWSGTFIIDGKDYNIGVSVRINSMDGEYDDAASEKLSSEKYVNFIINAYNDKEELEKNQGVGFRGEVLELLKGEKLRPYISTGAHELGHYFNLKHADTKSEDKIIDGQKIPVESIMGKITIFKNKQYRNYPSNYEWNLVYQRNKNYFN